MGAVTFSIDLQFVKCLKKSLPLSVFVETGTFEGDSIANVLNEFDQLITIERSEVLWNKVVERFNNIPKVNAFLGNSPEILERVRDGLDGASVLFWLDAHWCTADNTFGVYSQCPLLEEIRAINKLNEQSVLMIDDARLFLAPPSYPHEVSQWPVLDEVLKALDGISNQHAVMILNDVIVYFPKSCRNSINEYARTNGVDWLSVSPYLDPKNNLIESLREKEKLIQSQHRRLQQLHKEIEDKQHIIEEMKAYFWFCEALYRPFIFIFRPVFKQIRPRLGTLNHHPPREVIYSKNIQLNALTTWPTISIVTPSFNQASFIERTIQSVLSQTYPRLEYYIQDGKSDDGTVEILKQYEKKLSGWESVSDNGQSQAINLGFLKTSGEIMAWINSDDILLPGTLAFVADYFSKHPEIDVVYGNRILINENDQQIGRWVLPSHDDSVLSWVDYVPQETVFWRRAIWERAGGMVDESFQFAMDWDLLLRFRNVGARIVRLQRFLGAFRVHSDQKTSTVISSTGLQEMNNIRLRELGRIPLQREVRKAVIPYLLKHIVYDLWWRIRSTFKID